MISTANYFCTRLTQTIAVLMIVAVTACSGDPRPLEEAVEVNEIGLTRLVISSGVTLTEDIFINPTEQLQFDFTAFDAQATELELDNNNRRWSVSNSAVASITDEGLLTGRSNGEVTIGLDIGGIVATAVTVFVSDAELASIDTITGPASITECSRSTAYNAVGTFTDGSQRQLKAVDWTLADPDSGLLLDEDLDSVVVGSRGAGSITLQATEDNVSGNLIIEVAADALTLSVLPADQLDIERTSSVSLVARAQYSDETLAAVSELVIWSLDEDSGIVTLVQNNGETGVLTGVANGTTSVTATCGDNTANVIVEVVNPDFDSLEIDASDDPLILSLTGSGEQLEAIASSIEGASENVTDTASWSIRSGSDVLQVGNSGSSRGFITPLRAGSAVVAVSFSGITGEATLSVTVR